MNTVMMPSSPNDRDKVKKAVLEICNSMTRIDAEKDLIREILNDLKETYELPPKYIRKVAAVHHKQTISEFVDETSEIEAIYDTLMRSNP